MEEKASPPMVQVEREPPPAADKDECLCDRCGTEMVQRNCKVVCPNCGNRFDCSDLTLYFD